MKTKILAYLDSPTCATGFGNVAKNVLGILHATGKYEIEIFGINYHGMPSPYQKIYNIWPAMDVVEGDPYGRKRFCQHALQSEFDILFIIQDSFIVDFLPELIPALNKQMNDSNVKRKPFKSIMYYPTDSIIKPLWYYNMSFVDKLVSYTKFGVEEAKLAAKELEQMVPDTSKNKINFESVNNIDVIYHGFNETDFFPLKAQDIQEFRRHYFKSHADDFIFMNINRNQQRKDIPRTLVAFKEFKKLRPKSLLYLHMAKKDQGWDIAELCKGLNLHIGVDVVLPDKFEPNQGYPVEVVNMLYNSVDCGISTTTGEGFGLQWLEFMACNKPVIMPNNTAMAELITKDVGYLAKSGSDLNLWASIPNDNDIIRPLVDVNDLVSIMCEVYDNYDEAKIKSLKAFNWATDNFRWSGNIAKQWKTLFNTFVKDIKEERSAITDDSNVIRVESF
jgi:glycosyltransferase involved in cell wall biosynthesis